MVLLLLSFLWLAACNQTQKISDPPRSGLVQLATTQLEYEIMGSGEPLVIIHGGPGLEFGYFMPGILELAKHYQLIFYHQRGTGKSVGLLDSTTLTIDQFVEDLEGLRSHLKLDKMHLLGHSWGGVLNVNYTLKYPGRVSSLILASSVGMNTGSLTSLGENIAARTTPEIAEALTLITISPEFATGDSSAINAYLTQVFKTYVSDPQAPSALPKKMGAYSSSNFLKLYGGLIGKELADYDIQNRLLEISCPTLFIHGEDDPMPVEMLEDMAQNIVGSSFKRLAKTGHFPFAESPELTNQAILEFLSK
ncbi:alpha/beta fold hydrolase [bacterium]|nr:alpha/beta fold hydrolase [bacterium]